MVMKKLISMLLVLSVSLGFVFVSAVAGAAVPQKAAPLKISYGTQDKAQAGGIESRQPTEAESAFEWSFSVLIVLVSLFLLAWAAGTATAYWVDLPDVRKKRLAQSRLPRPSKNAGILHS